MNLAGRKTEEDLEKEGKALRSNLQEEEKKKVGEGVVVDKIELKYI